MGASADCPIAGMPDGEVTAVFPGGRTRCLSSSSPLYAFDVIPGASDKLLLYFEGGGLCFNGVSDFLHTCAKEAHEDPMIPEDGVFSRSASNPFRDYTVVFVNYCSGDMFLSDSDFGDSEVQRGLVNAEAAVAWAQANMPQQLASLVLIGESAGGAAIQFWSRTLLHRFSYSHAAVIVDSLILGNFPRPAQVLLSKKYGLCTSGLLREWERQSCEEGTLDLNNLLAATVDEHPEVMFAIINSKADMVQILMYNFMAPMLGVTPASKSASEYLATLNEYLAGFQAKPNFASYLISSDVHCWTSKKWLLTTDTTGDKGAGLHGDMTLRQWLKGFTTPGDVPIMSQCSGKPIPHGQWPPMDLDYCDELQVRKMSSRVVTDGSLVESPKGGFQSSKDGGQSSQAIRSVFWSMGGLAVFGFVVASFLRLRRQSGSCRSAVSQELEDAESSDSNIEEALVTVE